jgi:hypothetical protein
VHALRATAATNAVAHDADIAKVQEWLGTGSLRGWGCPEEIIYTIFRKIFIYILEI